MKRKLITILFGVLMTLFMFNFTSCSSENIVLSKSEANILVGETISLQANISGGTDSLVVEWSTSDFYVATVRNGTVRGIKEGSATITATYGKATATCEITVSTVDVKISQSTATIEKGETLSLTATASDNGAIVWYSEDSNIADVDDNGLVIAKKEGKVNIVAERGSAGRAECLVEVVWKNKPSDYKEFEFGEEKNQPFENKDTWFYWNDQGWAGSNVVVIDASLQNGKAIFEYEGNNACWYGFQIYYQSSITEIGKSYRMTCNIYSSQDANVTICGTPITLKSGDNDVNLYFVQSSSKASFSFQAGQMDNGKGEQTFVEKGKFIISNLNFSAPEKLKTPTSITINNDKIVTITDDNNQNAQSYRMAFCNEKGEIKYVIAVKNGEKIDDSTIENGTYSIKLCAVGDGFINSDYSDILTVYTVSNVTSSYMLKMDTEVNTLDKYLGTWVYFSKSEADGGEKSITDAKYENGVISLNIVDCGEYWWSNQLFYKNAMLTSGKDYTLTFNLNSSQAGRITINNVVKDVNVGDNEFVINYTESDKEVSFRIMFGVDGEKSLLNNAEIKISNVNFTSYNASYGEGIPANFDGDPIFGNEKDATEKAGKLCYWNDQGWCGSQVKVNNISIVEGKINFNYSFESGSCWFGAQLFYKNTNNVTGLKYKLFCKIISDVSGNITFNGKEITLNIGENNIEVEYTETNGASFILQMGTQTNESMISKANIEISDLCYFEAK